MILALKPHCSPQDAESLVSTLEELGLSGYLIAGQSRMHVEVLGASEPSVGDLLKDNPLVEQVLENGALRLAAARVPGEQTREISLGRGVSIGRRLAVLAGPCSVESPSQIVEVAQAVQEAGAVALRGGAFKPRTSPYSFQGHGERGLEWLALAREQTGLPVVTEVMRGEDVSLVAGYADVLQVGSRNMHNTTLLRAVGQQAKPVLLKRGWSATLEEFLWAAEYVLLEGNTKVILCERGIRTYETYVRNTLALAIVPEIKRISSLPILVDPSHGTGHAHLVAPMSYAAIACGADGLLVEVHSDPKRAWTDGPQTLDFAQFGAMMDGLRRFASAARREL